MSGSTAVNLAPAAESIAARQPPAGAAEASSATGVTTSSGFSSPERPVISLDTTNCRPRTSVATPLTTVIALS